MALPKPARPGLAMASRDTDRTRRQRQERYEGEIHDQPTDIHRLDRHDRSRCAGFGPGQLAEPDVRIAVAVFRREHDPIFWRGPSRSASRPNGAIGDCRKTGRGLPGAQSVAKGAADGLTFMLTSNGHVAINAVNKNISFDAVKDFAPIAKVRVRAVPS